MCSKITINLLGECEGKAHSMFNNYIIYLLLRKNHNYVHHCTYLLTSSRISNKCARERAHTHKDYSFMITAHPRITMIYCRRSSK